MTLKKFLLFFLLSTAASARTEGLSIHSAWARETPPGSRITAAYLTISNNGKETDHLIGVSSDLAKVEIHDTRMVNGMMEMKEIKELPIPANGKVSLLPNSKHLMLSKLSKTLKAGETLTLTLNFKKAGQLQVKVPIKKP